MGWIALALITTGLISLISWNLRRSKENITYEIKPNCLITKYPIVFIEGKKSIFYFLNYWNQLPHFLSQHGYEVFEYDLHWRNSKKRIQQIKDFLKEAENHNFKSPTDIKKYHLVIDRSSLNEVKELFLKESFNSVASCTLITNRSPFFPVALKHPIEDIIVPKTQVAFRLKVIWIFHQFWTQSWGADLISLSVQIGASQKQKDEIKTLQNKILDQAILLAERDFVFNSTSVQHQRKIQQGSKQHDDSSNGTSNHHLSTENLPSPSC